MFTALSSISINDLQPSTSTGTQSNTHALNTPKQVPAPASQADTVKLSVTQQVRNLHSEGEGPGQIASSLGLTSSQVNGDLYVSLTWPQLLSKVASSSLTLGSTSSDASPAAAAAPAAAVFPTAKTDSAAPAAGTSEAKSVTGPDQSIFPPAKDSYASAADGVSKSEAAA